MDRGVHGLVMAMCTEDLRVARAVMIVSRLLHVLGRDADALPHAQEELHVLKLQHEADNEMAKSEARVANVSRRLVRRTEAVEHAAGALLLALPASAPASASRVCAGMRGQ